MPTKLSPGLEKELGVDSVLKSVDSTENTNEEKGAGSDHEKTNSFFNTLLVKLLKSQEQSSSDTISG